MYPHRKEIALFDFDGTITTKDTMLVFLRYLAGDAGYFANMLLLSPIFLMMKLGLVSDQRAKEILLQRFIGGKKETDLVDACSEFSRNILPGIIRPKALETIRQHLADGAEVVVVSAAPEYWVKDWCNAHGLNLIATQLQVNEGIITGRIEGLNCKGREKVKRITSAYTLDAFDKIYAYGDTKADKPMLALAQQAFYKPFR